MSRLNSWEIIYHNDLEYWFKDNCVLTYDPYAAIMRCTRPGQATIFREIGIVDPPDAARVVSLAERILREWKQEVKRMHSATQNDIPHIARLIRAALKAGFGIVFQPGGFLATTDTGSVLVTVDRGIRLTLNVDEPGQVLQAMGEHL